MLQYKRLEEDGWTQYRDRRGSEVSKLSYLLIIRAVFSTGDNAEDIALLAVFLYVCKRDIFGPD